MAFPIIAPGGGPLVDGQTTLINGVMYIYSLTNGSWSPLSSSNTITYPSITATTSTITGTETVGNSVVTGNEAVQGNETVSGNQIVLGNLGVGTNTPAVKLAIVGTDAVLLPVGTTVQRPSGVAGYVRYNSDNTSFEGFNGTGWGSLGGATGGGLDQVFYLNSQTVTTSYTIPTNYHAGSVGPIAINSGVTVTIPSGSVWSIN